MSERTTNSLIARFNGGETDHGPDAEENLEKFIEAMECRRRQRKPVVIVIDGRETGVGKSTLGMQICRRLDAHFRLENITYSARETLDLYSRAEPGIMVDWDESVLGLLTRKGTRDEELAGIIGALSVQRKNQIGTVLTVPKIQMLDALVYNGLAPVWLFVEGWGRARPHRAHRGVHYRKSQPRMPYDLWDALYPIGFKSLDRDPMFRASVQRAIEKNRAYFHEQAQISDVKRARLLGLPRNSTNYPSGDNVAERATPSQVSVCPECGKAGLTPWNLRVHLGAAHGGAPGKSP